VGGTVGSQRSFTVETYSAGRGDVKVTITNPLAAVEPVGLSDCVSLSLCVSLYVSISRDVPDFRSSFGRSGNLPVLANPVKSGYSQGFDRIWLDFKTSYVGKL